MSTVAELRQQLETLKKRNGDEIAQATKEVERLQKELEDIAAITEPIEKEINELQRQCMPGRRNRNDSKSSNSGASILSNVMLGLVDPNDGKCKKRWEPQWWFDYFLEEEEERDRGEDWKGWEKNKIK